MVSMSNDQTLHFSKPFGTISSWFSFVVETGSSKRRGGGSAGIVNTTEMLLDAIKDLWEEGTLSYLVKTSSILLSNASVALLYCIYP